MGSEWKKALLDNVCLLITDGSHYSPRSVEVGFPMVSVKDFSGFGFDFSNCRQVNKDDYDELVRNGCRPEIDDILIGKDGARYFEDVIIYKQQERPVLLSSIAIIRANTEKIIPEFLFYYLFNKELRQQVKDNLGSGSAIPRMVLKDIKRIPIVYPDIKTQNSIAATLSSLDDKIELNNRIIANLEAQAQAVYTDIFQDDDSAIELGDVCATTSGGTPSRSHPEYFRGNISWVKSKELNSSFLLSTEETVTEGAIAESSAKILPLHSVLIAMYGATVGEYCVTTTEAACNQAICAILPNEVYPYEYLFQVAKNSRDNLKGLAIGSAQQNINQQTVKTLLVSNDTSKITMFHEIASPIFACIENKCQEKTKLALTRDTLLPKLMSGEIEVLVEG